jgi:hypothetical protein
MCCELVDAERASEEATVIVRRLQKNEPGVLQVRWLKQHESSRPEQLAAGADCAEIKPEE